MEMASVLMSIANLCLVTYGKRFASDVLIWTLGPMAKKRYLEVRTLCERKGEWREWSGHH